MAVQQKFTIRIPKGYTETKRQAIAKRVLEFVKERTKAGKNVQGQKFPPYSEQYKKFKGQSNVDLELSGEMLEKLEILLVGYAVITIGYKALDAINDRVEGNRLGSYGGDPDMAKSRDFLGISEKDLNYILAKEFPMNDFERSEGTRDNQVTAQIQSLTKEQRRLLMEDF